MEEITISNENALTNEKEDSNEIKNTPNSSSFSLCDFSNEIAEMLDWKTQIIDETTQESLSALCHMNKICHLSPEMPSLVVFSDMATLAEDITGIFNDGIKAVTKNRNYIDNVCKILNAMLNNCNGINSGILKSICKIRDRSRGMEDILNYTTNQFLQRIDNMPRYIPDQENKLTEKAGGITAGEPVDVQKQVLERYAKEVRTLPFPIFYYSIEIAIIWDWKIRTITESTPKSFTAASQIAKIWASSYTSMDLDELISCMDTLAIDIISMFDIGHNEVNRNIDYIHSVCKILNGMAHNDKTANAKAVMRFHEIKTRSEAMMDVLEPETQQLLDDSEPEDYIKSKKEGIKK